MAYIRNCFLAPFLYSDLVEVLTDIFHNASRIRIPALGHMAGESDCLLFVLEYYGIIS